MRQGESGPKEDLGNNISLLSSQTNANISHTHTHLGRVKAERVFAFVMSTAAAPLLLQKHTVASGRETER